MLTWTEDDDRTFHRYAWFTEAGWAEMTGPCELDQLGRPPLGVRTHRGRGWFFASAGLVVGLLLLLAVI